VGGEGIPAPPDAAANQDAARLTKLNTEGGGRVPSPRNALSPSEHSNRNGCRHIPGSETLVADSPEPGGSAVTPAEDTFGTASPADLTGGRILGGRVVDSHQPSREGEVRENNAPAAEETRYCSRCRRDLPLDQFRPNPEMLSGLHCWCRPCVSENMRRWRAQNAEYVAAYNVARREGPFPKTCSVCGREWLATRRRSVRCPVCQAPYLRERKR
jgi:hypothetical protein